MWDRARAYTRIKLCWFESLDAAWEASHLGVDALGFHAFAARHTLAERIARFAEILPPLPGGVHRTLLTDLPIEAIRDLAAAAPLDAIQLYPDWSAGEVASLRAAVPGARILKVMSARPEENFTADEGAFLARYEGAVDAILLDSFREGGTGITADWDRCAAIVARAGIPVFLAGGLHPGNVAEAIERVRPFGVDVETGVSDRIPGGPLVKNLRKCRELVDAVVRYDRDRVRLGPTR